MQRFKLFGEWQDRVVIGTDITHALEGRKLEGRITYKPNGEPLPQCRLTIVSVEGTRANPNNRRGDQMYRTAIVIDDNHMGHEVDYQDLGSAYDETGDTPYSKP